MHRRRFLAAGRQQHTARATLTLALAAALTGGLIGAHAQTVPAPTVQNQPTLREAFEAAWARQPEAQALAARFWPGPLTLVLPKVPIVPDVATAGLPTAARRDRRVRPRAALRRRPVLRHQRQRCVVRRHAVALILN